MSLTLDVIAIVILCESEIKYSKVSEAVYQTSPFAEPVIYPARLLSLWLGLFVPMWNGVSKLKH